MACWSIHFDWLKRWSDSSSARCKNTTHEIRNSYLMQQKRITKLQVYLFHTVTGFHLSQSISHAGIIVQVQQSRPAFWPWNGRSQSVYLFCLLAWPVQHLTRCEFHREHQTFGAGLILNFCISRLIHDPSLDGMFVGQENDVKKSYTRQTCVALRQGGMKPIEAYKNWKILSNINKILVLDYSGCGCCEEWDHSCSNVL